MYTYFQPVKIDNCVIIFKYISRVYRDKENSSEKNRYTCYILKFLSENFLKEKLFSDAYPCP